MVGSAPHLVAADWWMIYLPTRHQVVGIKIRKAVSWLMGAAGIIFIATKRKRMAGWKLIMQLSCRYLRTSPTQNVGDLSRINTYW